MRKGAVEEGLSVQSGKKRLKRDFNILGAELGGMDVQPTIEKGGGGEAKKTKWGLGQRSDKPKKGIRYVL